MKKLILMLLVLVGGVMQANATKYKVYFQPGNSWTADNAIFALYMYSSTSNSWEAFTETSTSGLYSAEYDDTYDSNIILVRLRPSTANGYSDENEGLNWTNKWNQTSNLACPTSDVYYSNPSGSGDSYSVTTKEFHTPFYVGAEHDIAPSYVGWTANETTQMTDNGNLTFTKTVTGNLIGADTYGFKIIDGADHWLGDPNNYSNNYELQISQAGTYDITYTYNVITGVATAVPTKTSDTAPTYTYNVWCQDANNVDAITVGGWSDDANKMTLADGVASITYENKDLTAQTYSYKIVKRSFNGENELYKQWIGEPGGANKTFTISKASKYNVTFNYTVSSKTPSSSVTEQFTGYYLIGNYGTDGWVVGDALTQTGDVYSITVENNGSNYYRFDLVPNTSLNSSNTIIENNDTYWGTLVRPNATDDVVLGFANVTDAVASTTNSNQAWQIPAANTTKVVFSYNKANNTWSVAPYFTRTIKGAKSNGNFYATFSSNYKVAIPEGIAAYYAASNQAAGNSVAMTQLTNNIPAGVGAFIKLTDMTDETATGKEYTFYPAATDAEITADQNWLKASTGTITYDANTPRYVFARKKATGDVGFYIIDANVSQTGKAYLEPTASVTPAPALSIDIDGETTGIVLPNVNEAVPGVNDGQIYDLSGRRVENPTKGLYIVNGKKVFIK